MSTSTSRSGFTGSARRSRTTNTPSAGSFPRIAEIGLEASEDGQWLLASVANGDGGDFAHYLRDAAGKWQQLTRFEDGIKHAQFGRDGALYLLSRKDAPRGKVLRLPLME